MDKEFPVKLLLTTFMWVCISLLNKTTSTRKANNHKRHLCLQFIEPVSIRFPFLFLFIFNSGFVHMQQLKLTTFTIFNCNFPCISLSLLPLCVTLFWGLRNLFDNIFRFVDVKSVFYLLKLWTKKKLYSKEVTKISMRLTSG